MVPAVLRLLLAGLAVCALVAPAHAYIGPGAGFAAAGSVLVLLGTFLLAFAIILIWPFKAAIRMVTAPRRGKSKVKRVVIVGLDGFDPRKAREYMDAGRMPHLQRLAQEGTFAPLATACPSISPVAWSTFATGTDASRHNIYDFLTRDPCSYAPVLSSTDTKEIERTLNLGFAHVTVGHKHVHRPLQRSCLLYTSPSPRDS